MVPKPKLAVRQLAPQFRPFPSVWQRPRQDRHSAAPINRFDASDQRLSLAAPAPAD